MAGSPEDVARAGVREHRAGILRFCWGVSVRRRRDDSRSGYILWIKYSQEHKKDICKVTLFFTHLRHSFSV